MTREQDISALAAALATGVAAGLYAVSVFRGQSAPYALASVSFSIVIALIIWLRASNVRSISGLILLYIFVGLSCSSAYTISSAGQVPGTGFLTAFAERTRAMIISMPFKSENTAPLITALVTGDKSYLDTTLLSAFRESGASHILALSGLHLGIIYGILLKATSALGNAPGTKRVRSIFIMAFAGAYTLATGACPALVRALLFIILNETAKLTHRKIGPAQVFCTALIIQLIITPNVLSSIGFQLSYLAMAGIFILYPRLKSWYPGNDFKKSRNARSAKRILNRMPDIPRKIWDASALTISCQIFTGPLAWLTFGTFPKYFLLTNILALPVTSILMTSAFVSVILSMAGICPQALLAATDCAASILTHIMEIISTM